MNKVAEVEEEKNSFLFSRLMILCFFSHTRAFVLYCLIEKRGKKCCLAEKKEMNNFVSAACGRGSNFEGRNFKFLKCVKFLEFSSFYQH